MMQNAITFLSVVPMRKEPDHRSEMVSQILFGEFVKILEEQKEFVKVQCAYDGYEGWVQANQLTKVDRIFTTNNYTTNWSSVITVKGKPVRVSMCSPVYSEGLELNIDYGNAVFLNCDEHVFSEAALKTVYEMFLQTPYLWGGRSVFGIDCSGFVQQVFKMFGKKLLRDASMQAGQGAAIESLDKVVAGDLAFFQNENGRITHVGIILSDNKIVHASGKVRIDSIDEKGILNSDTGKRTHQIHSYRRIFNVI